MLNAIDILSRLMFTEIPGDPPPAEPPEDNQTVPITDLRKANSEAAGWRTKLREAEAENAKLLEEKKKAVEDAKLAELGEVEKYQTIATQAQADTAAAQEIAANAASSMAQMAKQQAVFNVAAAAGFHHPNDAVLHLDLAEIDMPDGKIDMEKVTELINTLAESRADLLSEAPPDGSFGPTNPPGPQPPGPKLINQNAIDKMKADSKALMRTGRMNEAIKLYNTAWEKERGLGK